jgi:DME family drug/metabolite transporter
MLAAVLPLGELSALTCAALWAASTVGLRSQTARVPVLALNAIRTAYASVVVLLGLLVLGRLGDLLTVAPGALLGLLGSVLVGKALGETLHIRAMHAIGVSRALPISSSYPILASILAALFLNEALTPKTFVGILLVVVGVYLVAFPRPRGKIKETISAPVRTGVLFALCAALCWSLSTVLVRPALDLIDPILANGVRLPVACALLTALSLRGERGANPFAYGWRAGAVLAVAGVLSGISGAFWLYAVSEAGAAKAATLSSTAPIFAAPLSVLLLGERLTAQIALGTLVTVVGIWLVL